jgi:hypothetical protein
MQRCLELSVASDALGKITTFITSSVLKPFLSKVVVMSDTETKNEQNAAAKNSVGDAPYSGKSRILLATSYADLGYPDLAVGEAYMALMLSDETQDESGEYHIMAYEAAVTDMDDKDPSEQDVVAWVRASVELPA